MVISLRRGEGGAISAQNGLKIYKQIKKNEGLNLVPVAAEVDLGLPLPFEYGFSSLQKRKNAFL